MTISYVFDTFAKTDKGRIMHFNVVLDENNQDKAIRHAQHWLLRINQKTATVTPSNCMLYHSLEVPNNIRQDIDKYGYAIFKLEGCP